MANVCCHPRLAPDQRCQTARRDQRTDDRVSRPANRNCLSAARAFLVPAPQACVRVGRSLRAVSAPSPPMRGGWSADRRTLSFGRACDARPPVPARPGPLSALHRGDFRMRTHEAGSRQWNRSRSDCPRQAVMAWRSGSGPPALRFRAAARDATPRSAFRFVSGDAPHERGWRLLIYQLRFVVKI